MKKRKLILGGVKKLILDISIDIKNITKIDVIKDAVVPKRLVMIEICLKDGSKYRTLGYSSLLHKKDIYVTTSIVEQIKEEISI